MRYGSRDVDGIRSTSLELLLRRLAAGSASSSATALTATSRSTATLTTAGSTTCTTRTTSAASATTRSRRNRIGAFKAGRLDVVPNGGVAFVARKFVEAVVGVKLPWELHRPWAG